MEIAPDGLNTTHSGPIHFLTPGIIVVTKRREMIIIMYAVNNDCGVELAEFFSYPATYHVLIAAQETIH
jgi:hypothetical protein